MSRIYPGYPKALSDRDLTQAVDEYIDEINQSGVNINNVLQLSPYIQLGLSELQGRTTKRVTRLSLGVSFLSLVVAGLALYLSLQGASASSA